MADVSVRPARAGDAADLARIQVDTWRSAYQGILPAAVLSGLAVREVEATWVAAITAPPSPRHRVFVALEQDWRVGFAAAAPDDEDDATFVLGPILVEPRWGRRGHGSRLLAAITDHARGDALLHGLAWVLEADTASTHFLTSAGWATDGFVRGLDTGAGELREHRLHVALDPT
jgi:GNAT superfamily N-acetyltransferase